MTTTPDPSTDPTQRDWAAEAVRVMRRLRAPDGCPWDHRQTHHSLKKHLVEETCELLDAIDQDKPDEIEDELGDLLLQVLFHSQIAAEAGHFDFQGVARRLTRKLVRRHPHVFNDASADTPDAVVQQWEQIKNEERGGERDALLDGIPTQLPALATAQKLQKRAADVGFDWDTIDPVLEKIEEELGELRQAMRAENEADRAAVKHELGDLLFALVNLSRFLDVDAEDALRQCNHRFRRRFRHVEQCVNHSGRAFAEHSLDELDQYWEQAKNRETHAP